MCEYQIQNIKAFEDMYRQGWGNEWPSELLISYYHSIIKPHILRRGGVKPKVLEFACGTGANLRFFDDMGFEVYGIDSSESAISRCIQRGYKEENFFAVDILNGRDIIDLWPDTKFDLIICLSALLYFDDNDIKRLSTKFYEALRPEGILYTNFYTTVREWPMKQMENGLYIVENSGSVDELTYLNLLRTREDIRKYYKELFEEIAIKRVLIEGSLGDNETLHYFGYRK